MNGLRVTRVNPGQRPSPSSCHLLIDVGNLETSLDTPTDFQVTPLLTLLAQTSTFVK